MSEAPRKSGDAAGEGFTVHDRRLFGADGRPIESPAERAADAPANPEAAARAARAERRAATPPPPMDFTTFVVSLATSAMYHLGAIPVPEEGAPAPDLVLAKQTIDILGMLRDKTQGNLNAEESRVIENLLHDLRMRFVEATRKA